MASELDSILGERKEGLAPQIEEMVQIEAKAKEAANKFRLEQKMNQEKEKKNKKKKS